MISLLLLGAAVLLIIFSGLVVAIDAALQVTSRTDLADWARDRPTRVALKRLAADPEVHANSLAFIRVVAETAAAVFVTFAFVLWFDNPWWAVLAAIIIMTGISFVAVGASPRAAGRRHAQKLIVNGAPLVRGVRILLGPLAQLLVIVARRVTPGGAWASSFDSEEQLLSMVDEAVLQDLIEEDDRELIHSVFEFTDTYVREVMVPRTDMVTVSIDDSVRDALGVFLERGISRAPVIGEDGDDVRGIVYLKDLVQIGFRDGAVADHLKVAGIARPAVFVPESMRAETLLQQMKKDAVHVCLVVDEYGGVAGLVTLEDLIEELVGDIADEYDPRPDEVVDLGDGRFRVSARLPIDEVGDLFGIDLDDDEVDTVGGLLGKALGKVPLPGSTAEVAGLVLTGGASRGRSRGLATVLVSRATSTEESDEQSDGVTAEEHPESSAEARHVSRPKGAKKR